MSETPTPTQQHHITQPSTTSETPTQQRDITLVIHYIQPRGQAKISLVPPSSGILQAKTQVMEDAKTKAVRWFEEILPESFIIGKEFDNDDPTVEEIHAIVPMISDASPFLPDAIFQAWLWANAQNRELLHGKVMKLIQAQEASNTCIQDLARLVQNLDESLQVLQQKNRDFQEKKQLISKSAMEILALLDSLSIS